MNVTDRLARLDWPAIEHSLNEAGFANIGTLLDRDECQTLIGLYDVQDRFRSRVVMARHGFGRGEYQYFAEPLPDAVAGLREHAYARLSGIGNAWAERLGETRRFPDTRAELALECRNAGQTLPTPLLLRYGAGDYNCLHQDIYGELVFPLQIALLLSEPGEDFEGGEFVLTEQRPRMQSRVQVVPLRRGEAVIFAVRTRPVRGARGDYRVQMRHGVSLVRSGSRSTLGIIFHDAK
jgi:hypothetical protein